MNKTVLITGASAGIGKTTAQYFQQKGWQVAATMRSPEKEKELNELHNVKLFKLDVTSQESIQKAIEEIVSEFGGIDVVVNNAGFGVFGAFETATEEQIRKQFDTNVFGVMNVCRAILPYFRKKKEGIIVNVSSGVGRFALPIQSIYDASKFAVEGFTESLQYELEQFNIRVKLVEPGSIKTNFFNVVEIPEEKKNPYGSYQKKVMKKILEMDRKGSEPEVVAKEIFSAATDRKSKLRYPAGSDVKSMLKAKRLMPESMLFKMIKTMVGK